MDFKNLLEQSWKSFFAHLPPLLINTLVLLVVSVFSLGFLAPVCTAGYTQSILQAIRDDRRPDVKDLFTHMYLFLPLLGFCIAAGIIVALGLIILILPGILAGLALYFFCLYLLPLMTDRDLGLIEAVKESSRMALEEPVSEHVAVVAIYIGISALGQVVPFGFIFTLPFATLFMLFAYIEKSDEQVIIQSPGTSATTETSPPPPPPEESSSEEENDNVPRERQEE